MQFLVTGSNGQLGTAIREKIDGFTGLDLEDADIEMDVSDKRVSEIVRKEKPDVIVHAAAFTDVDGAEENPEKAEKVNVEGTRNILRAARDLDAHLIFISTDYVFDGEKGDYMEGDSANPLCEYAKTKLEAEEVIRSSDVNYTIFRSSVIFDKTHNNFFTWAKSELDDEGGIGAVTDQICRPTYAPNLADFVIEAAEETITGLYHATGNTKVSRYEAVQIMKEELDLEGEIKKIRMSDLPWSAERPKDSSLNLSKLREDFETEPINLFSAFSSELD